MLVLLQSRFDTQYIQEADPTTLIVAGAVLGGFVLMLVVAGITSRRNRRGGGRATGKSGGMGKSAFRRTASKLGLSKAQVRTLEYVRNRYSVRNPAALLTNSPQLDTYLNRAIHDIENQASDDASKEAQKLTLFRIKQAIERNSHKSQFIKDTRGLKARQAVSLTDSQGNSHRTEVAGVLRDAIAVEVPTDKGMQVRWKKWSPVEVFFWKPNGEGYSFSSKVIGYNNFRGRPSVFLQHTGKIQRAKQRRYRRKGLDRPCYFYPVRVVSGATGRKQTKKALVETRRGMIGTVIEVSAGGCSIRATRVLVAGSLVKVDFETDRGNSVSTYGKVVNTHQESRGTMVMHIMFTRLSRRNLNRINSYIYEYGQTT